MPRLAVLIAIFLSLGHPLSHAQEIDTAASLDQLVAKARSPLSLVQETEEAEMARRTNQYIADLRQLEDGVAEDTGSLDAVILVREEANAWEKGESTPPIDPKDEAFPLPLRKLRYYFDQDKTKIAAQAAAASQRITPEVMAALETLETALTRAKRVDDALRVRRERETLRATLAVKGTAAATDNPASSTPLLSGLSSDANVLLVSPNGAGDSLTLDEALQQAKPGQVLQLKRGDYPPSEVFEPINNHPAYHVTVANISILGDRSVIPESLFIAADKVRLEGLQCGRIQIGLLASQIESKDNSIAHCRYRELLIENHSAATIRNSVGSIRLWQRAAAEVEDSTVAYYGISSTPELQFFNHLIFLESTSTFTRCVIRATNTLFFTDYTGPTTCALRDCLIYSDKDYLVQYLGAGKKTNGFSHPDDLKDFNFTMKNVTIAEPIFADPETNDLRLLDKSPGKATSFNERDLGANIAADGWPEPIETR